MDLIEFELFGKINTLVRVKRSKSININYKNIYYMRKLLLFLLTFVFIACSDNSTGPDEADITLGEGTLTVTGDIQAEHEGISQYVGLRNDDGNFLNLTLHVNQFGLGSDQENNFGFQIRLVGSDGPFTLDTGEYQIGVSNNVNILASYSNRTVSENTVTYGSTPLSSGTITILSISSTSIEAVFDVSLHLVEEEGSVNITGAFNAECLTADAGFGC